VTDYTHPSGGGTMLIRDTGSTVEFFFQAGDSSDWVNGLAFNWTANGSTTGNSIDYPTGRPNYHVGSVTVSTSQTVTFRLLSDTNISGIGGPTSFGVSLNRASKPSAPTTPSISAIKSTSVVATFSDGSNGGDAIDSREITYGLSSAGGTTNISSDRSTTITGLTPGKVYYFWARCHNSEGYGPWSGRASATTLNVPAAPSTPTLSGVSATTVTATFTPNATGGSTITAYQVGYGTDPTTPATTISASSPQTVTGLVPGTKYYFWARAQNSVGWSAWSAVSSISTIAGAYILVGTSWKIATPYVRVSGVWKVAEPWVKNAGVWKRTN